jgi:hypothetical protein
MAKKTTPEVKHVYILNTSGSGITCSAVKEEEVNGKTRRTVIFKKEFPRKRITREGQIDQSGVTKITEAEFNTLVESGIGFKQFLERGIISKHDSIPAGSLTAVDIITDLRREKAELAEKVRELEALVEKTAPPPKD